MAHEPSSHYDRQLAKHSSGWVTGLLQMELSCLSRLAAQLQGEDLTFERLEVDASVAQRIFEDNRFVAFAVLYVAAAVL